MSWRTCFVRFREGEEEGEEEGGGGGGGGETLDATCFPEF